MYIECFITIILLKLSSFATMLPIHDDNNVNTETALLYPNYTSILYPATISKRAIKQSSDGNRVEFQIRNHRGPGTYIFGFDTGHGKNRQFRIEERLYDGSIKGQYGFYDARSKLRIINYAAKPDGGYQERHHETNIFK